MAGADDDHLEDAKQLFAEIELRRLRGEPADVERVLAEHPAEAALLRSLLDTEHTLAQAAGLAALASASRAHDAATEHDLAQRVAGLVDDLSRLSPRRWPFGREAEIGRGTFGVVTTAQDAITGRRVALKRANLSECVGVLAWRRPRVTARLLEEARLLGRLRHAHVVPLLSVLVDEAGEPCLVMPVLEGIDLREAIAARVAKRPPWTLPRLVEALRAVCAAVSHAHEHGVIHRDLKPDNVRLDERGNVHVIDWGLALDLRRGAPPARSSPSPSLIDEHLASRLTQAGGAVGTLHYMSPEQHRGGAQSMDPRSDVYSLGAILYHVLWGEPPVPRASPRPPGAHAPPTGRSGPEPPAALLAICAKAMHEQREQRYATAQGLADDLAAFLDQRTVAAYASGPLAELLAWTRRNRVVAALGLALAATLAVTTVLAVMSREGERRANTELGLALTDREARNTQLESARQRLVDDNIQLFLQQVELAHEAGRSEHVLELIESVSLGDARRRLSEMVLGVGTVSDLMAEFPGAGLPSSPDARELAALLAASDHYHEWQLFLRGRRNPDDEAFVREAGRLAWLRGVALMRLGRYQEASLSLSLVPPDHADRGEALMALSSTALIRGDEELANLRMALAQEQGVSPDWEHLGKAWRARNSDAVIEHLTDALRADPFDQVSRSQLLVLYAVLADDRGLLAHRRTLETLAPQADVFRVIDVLAACRLGDYERALALSEKATAHAGQALGDGCRALVAWQQTAAALPTLALFTGPKEDFAAEQSAVHEARLAAGRLANALQRGDLFHPVLSEYGSAMAEGLRIVAMCGHDMDNAFTAAFNMGRLAGAANAFERAHALLGDAVSSLMLGVCRYWRHRQVFQMKNVRPEGADNVPVLAAAMDALEWAVELPSITPGTANAARRWLSGVHFEFWRLHDGGFLRPAFVQELRFKVLENTAALVAQGNELWPGLRFRAVQAARAFGFPGLAGELDKHLIPADGQARTRTHGEFEALHGLQMDQGAWFSALETVELWLAIDPQEPHALAARAQTRAALLEHLPRLQALADESEPEPAEPTGPAATEPPTDEG